MTASVDAAGEDARAASGCGAATWPTGGLADPRSIDVADASGDVLSRHFFVVPPTNYDPSTPHRLIFAWHYYGGTASDLVESGIYGLPPLLSDAIYVVGQGLTDATGRAAWPNTNGQNIAFTRSMIAWMETNYCVDPARIRSTGMSYGGEMSDLIGCQMPDVFRALGVMSGELDSYGPGNCVAHPIAAWITHGTADATIDISFGETAVYQFQLDDACGSTTTGVSPDLCVSYDGCAAGYPLIWCPVANEGHVIPSFAASDIASFFAQF